MPRRRLPDHLRWPISRADLQTGLGTTFDLIRVVWAHWDRSGNRSPLVASWVPAEGQWPPGSPAGASVWLRPVPRDDFEVIRTALQSDALPSLARWLTSALSAPPTWQGMRHERRWALRDGQLVVQDDDGMHILDRERNGRRHHD